MDSCCEVAWAAGLYEGEGSVGPQGGGTSCTLAITMTDREPLERFQAALGLGTLLGPYQPKGPRRKPIWRWTCNGYEKLQVVYEAFKDWLSPRRLAQMERLLTNRPKPRAFQDDELSPACGYDNTKSLQYGYRDHRRKGEPPCRSCLDAWKRYMRNWRQAHPKES